MSWYPELDALDKWLSVYRATCRHNRAEPDAGRHLLRWASEAGFTAVVPSAAVWCFATPADREWPVPSVSMSPTDPELWSDPTVGHAELRRAYVLIDRVRVGFLACATVWVLHLHLTMSPALEPDAMMFVVVSGLVAVLGIAAWFAVKHAPLGTGIAYAIAATVHGETLAGFGLRTALSTGLVSALRSSIQSGDSSSGSASSWTR